MSDQNDSLSSLAPARDLARGYPRSILLNRWLGAWIDFVVLAAFLFFPDLFLGNPLYQKTIFLWLGLVAAYFPITETLWGKSLGKLVSGTRVVNAEGGRPSWGQSIIRTLFRIIEVDFFLAGGLPAGIAVLSTEHRQRLGDMVAKTYVLRDKDLRLLRPLSGGLPLL